MSARVTLAPEILDWWARAAQLASMIPGSTATDLQTRRQAARALSDRLAAEFTAPVPAGVEIQDTLLDAGDRAIRIRRYRVDGASGALPTQVFLHGGGFWSGSPAEALNDRLCAARALAAHIQILSIGYRLSPEHRFPAAAQDAIAVIDAAVADRTLGADPHRIGIGGNSAGAMIAASAAIMLRERGESPLMHQALEVLPAALAPVGESATAYAQGFGLDDAAALVQLYVGPGAPPAGASPLDVADLAGLPPALLLAAEFDPLRDSALAYADRLTAAGVPVILRLGAGHVHGSIGLTATFDRARQWQQIHSLALRTAYAS